MKKLLIGLLIGFTLGLAPQALADLCQITEENLHDESWEIEPLYRLTMKDRCPSYDLTTVTITKSEAQKIIKPFLKSGETLSPDDLFKHQGKHKQ